MSRIRTHIFILALQEGANLTAPLWLQDKMSAIGGSPLLAASVCSLAAHAAPTGSITLATSDGGEVQVDKEELCINSKFFSDLLVNCDTTRIAVDETTENLQVRVGLMCQGTS